MEQTLKQAVRPLLLGSSRHGWFNLMESTVLSQELVEGILFCQLKYKIYLSEFQVPPITVTSVCYPECQLMNPWSYTKYYSDQEKSVVQLQTDHIS